MFKKSEKPIVLFAVIVILAACAHEAPEQASHHSSTSAEPVVTQPAVQPPLDELSIVEKEKLSGRQPVLIQKQAEASQAKPVASRMAYDAVSAEADMTSFAPPLPHRPVIHPPYPVQDREKYQEFEVNPVKRVFSEPVSTFSIDVDTASYSNVRRMLNQGQLPVEHAVRVEEMINYFTYDYPLPDQEPFSVYTEVGPSPWDKDKKLLHIGIQGEQVENSMRKPANLVFLIDVSGSMRSPNKLGLLKSAMKMLVNQLNGNDKVGIVVYAGAAGVVLEPSGASDGYKIHAAIDQLYAGGSTNGGAGIHAAYDLAREHFIEGGINRVILATDGDFNVGTSSQQALKKLIEQKREMDISLSVLGFGMGNYNDALMQELAQNGNGNAYYIDSLNEARKVLVEDLSATLQTIASDVKIQIEFNPRVVSEYRLVGYETRALKREDFNNDKVDAGEIGAGHTVTALYELTLVDSENPYMDELRYGAKESGQGVSARPSAVIDSEFAFLRLRYKAPEGGKSKLLEVPLFSGSIKATLQETSDNFRFSAAVAAFGQLLQGGKYAPAMSFADIVNLAATAKGGDRHGYRSEFLQLVKLAEAMEVKHMARRHEG